MTERRYGLVTTFYSYKGGVGRSMALADVAVLLARMGSRVLVVDWDIEAPGLDTWLRPWLNEPIHDGLVEIVTRFHDLDPNDAARRIEPVPVPGVDDRLGLVRAGRTDATWAARAQAVHWRALYQGGFGRWLEDLRAAWQRDWDHVLIDSRTGLGDVGGICTMQLPQVLVTLFTPSLQSVEGAARVAAQAAAGQARMPIDRAPLRVVPVMTRLDNTEHELRRRWERHAIEVMGPLLTPWLDAPGREADLIRELAVPHVPYWSYGDELPVIRGSVEDRHGVEYAHETLALLLRRGLGDVSLILDQRKRAGSDGDAEVFVSYPGAFGDVARQLVEALRQRGLRVTWDRDLPPGEPWQGALDDLRDRARDAVVLVGPTSGAFQAREIAQLTEGAHARTGTSRLVPALLPGAAFSDLPEPLRAWRGTDMDSFGSIDAFADELVRALTR